MTLAGGRADVSQLTSMLPFGQLAGELCPCLPLEFTDVPSETCLYTECNQTVPDLALLLITKGEVTRLWAHVDMLILKNKRTNSQTKQKKPQNHRTISGESYITWQTQTGSYMDCDLWSNSYGDCSLITCRENSDYASSDVPTARAHTSFCRPIAQRDRLLLPRPTWLCTLSGFGWGWDRGSNSLWGKELFMRKKIDQLLSLVIQGSSVSLFICFQKE